MNVNQTYFWGGLILVVQLTMCTGFIVRGQETGNLQTPPKIVHDPGNYYRYSEHARKFTGIASLAVSPNDRIWATWYAGSTPREDENNYVVLSSSRDGGQSWEEILVVDPDRTGPVRAYDPQVWVDPDNNLWFFWTQNTIGYDGTVAGVWFMKTDTPDDKDAVWTKPVRLADGVMMNKPTVLSNGEWLFPVSTWRETDNSAKVLVSNDRVKTFNLRGACHLSKEDREFDEHLVVEKKDGTWWMLIRT